MDDLSKGAHGQKWEGCKVYKDYHAMLADKSHPDAMVIGVPPWMHGSRSRWACMCFLTAIAHHGAVTKMLFIHLAGSLDVPQFAMEKDLADAGLHMLIEKPISMRPAEEVGRLAKVCPAIPLPGKSLNCPCIMYAHLPGIDQNMLDEHALQACCLSWRHPICMQELDRIGKEQSIVIQVGYMLRYNPAIEAAKELLQQVRTKAHPVQCECSLTAILCITEHGSIM